MHSLFELTPKRASQERRVGGRGGRKNEHSHHLHVMPLADLEVGGRERGVILTQGKKGKKGRKRGGNAGPPSAGSSFLADQALERAGGRKKTDPPTSPRMGIREKERGKERIYVPEITLLSRPAAPRERR